MMPTRPLLDLSAALQHTVSSDTQCSVTEQILIRWCEASHLHQTSPLLQKRPADELPESPSMTWSCPAVGGGAADPIHGVPHST
jgi:hypothetical protein